MLQFFDQWTVLFASVLDIYLKPVDKTFATLISESFVMRCGLR